jgi:Flp pilus assembly CpaF family ATPase
MIQRVNEMIAFSQIKSTTAPPLDDIAGTRPLTFADLINTRRVSPPIAMTIAMVIVTVANALIAQRP